MIIIFQFNNKSVRANIYKCANGTFSFDTDELSIHEIRIINGLAKHDINCRQCYLSVAPDFCSLYGLLNFLNTFSQLIIIGEEYPIKTEISFLF